MSTSVTFQINETNSRTDSTGTQTSTDNDNTVTSLSDSSTPPATASGKAQVNLTAGAATLDLTAVATLDGRTVNLTGLKLRTLKVSALSGNTHDLTVAKGASNGYTGLGSSFSMTVHAGGQIASYDGGNGVAVNSTVKTLDLTGNTTEGVLVSFSAGA